MASHTKLGGLGVFALILFGSSVPRVQAEPQLFTSPIDVTGAYLQLHTAAPSRDTQQLVDVALPPGLLPPKMARLLGMPLSAQFDQYWNTVDPKTGLVPRQAACDGAPGQEGIKQTVVKEVAKIGSSYSAYDIQCNLATTGQLLAQQSGSTTTFAYQLTNNTVTFRATSPYSCNPNHTGYGCPNDPLFTVHFATQLVTALRTPSLCQISADQGTVYVVAASIEGDNAAGDIARFIKADKFIAAEVAITNTVRKLPLPIDDSLAELRNSGPCTGKTPGASHLLAGFRKLDTEIDPRNPSVTMPGLWSVIVLRATHVGIEAPQVGVPNPGGPPTPIPSTPSFTYPQITTSQPVIKAGSTVQVSGQHFPRNINMATTLPVSMLHKSYPGSSLPICLGGWTELEWGPVGRSGVQRLQGDAQGSCAKQFAATNLTASTGYQFRARDCDLITCSPWSAPVSVTTARIDPNWGRVVLTLDGGTPLGTGTIDAQGNFSASITIPAATPAGTHTIHAVNHINADNRDATATENVQVTAVTATSNASMMMVAQLQGQTGCPNLPILSAGTDDTFMLFGSGFGSGTVTIRLDTETGVVLGTATVRADGSFCQEAHSVPSSQAGKHTLVALQNGAVVARLATEFVRPSVIK
jgi:hypothetical protein